MYLLNWTVNDRKGGPAEVSGIFALDLMGHYYTYLSCDTHFCPVWVHCGVCWTQDIRATHTEWSSPRVHPLFTFEVRFWRMRIRKLWYKYSWEPAIEASMFLLWVSVVTLVFTLQELHFAQLNQATCYSIGRIFYQCKIFWKHNQQIWYYFIMCCLSARNA